MASSSSSERLWRGTSPAWARQIQRGGACRFQDGGTRIVFAVALEDVGEGPCDEANAAQGQSAPAERIRRVGHGYAPGSSSGCDDELCLVLAPSNGNSPDARRRSTRPFSRSSSCEVLLRWTSDWLSSARPGWQKSGCKMEGERLTRLWEFVSCGAGVPGLYSPSPGAYICQVVNRQYLQARQREAGRGCGACLSHGVPGSSLLRRHLACKRHLVSIYQVCSCQAFETETRPGRRRSGSPVLTLAVAQTAQALPHLPCWLLEPRAETGSTLRRFIASVFIT